LVKIALSHRSFLDLLANELEQFVSLHRLPLPIAILRWAALGLVAVKDAFGRWLGMRWSKFLRWLADVVGGAVSGGRRAGLHRGCEFATPTVAGSESSVVETRKGVSVRGQCLERHHLKGEMERRFSEVLSDLDLCTTRRAR
jgi:hypothetical protein